MSAKHTPGPWIVGGPHDAPWVSTADHKTHLPNSVEDARLIAAAPELLAALKLAEHTAIGGMDGDMLAALQDIMMTARAAIAKAQS